MKESGKKKVFKNNLLLHNEVFQLLFSHCLNGSYFWYAECFF